MQYNSRVNALINGLYCACKHVCVCIEVLSEIQCVLFIMSKIDMISSRETAHKCVGVRQLLPLVPQ